MSHPLVSLTLATLVLSSCATTTIVSSWKDPDARPIERGHKLMVRVVSRSPTVRREAEDGLAARLPLATPSHRLFTDRQLMDRDLVRRTLTRDGFTAFVVMRLVGVNKLDGSSAVDPGKRAVWDAYAQLADAEGDEPVHLQVQVEAQLFTVADGKLVWFAVSDVKDPQRLQHLLKEVTAAGLDRLKSDGLLMD